MVVTLFLLLLFLRQTLLLKSSLLAFTINSVCTRKSFQNSKDKICYPQISYNFMLPFEEIPLDLVPLTAHFKHLLTYASQQQPLLLFLDSVDQLTGAQDANRVSWLPLRLPPYCKVNNLIYFFYVGDNCNPAPNQLSIMSIWKAAILFEAFLCFL
jgi:hypothetical protein